MKFKFLTLVFLIVLSSCGSVDMDITVPRIRKSKLVKLNKSKSFANSDIKTVKINSKMSYEIGDSAHKLGLKIRIAKGEKIWMSADFFGIPMAKLLVEKDKVSYYNKIDKSYFEGSFDFLKQLSGVDVHYEDLEALLVGDSMIDIEKRIFKVFRGEGFYYLRNLDLGKFLSTVEIYPNTYKIKHQSLISNDNVNVFKSYYKKHKEIDDFMFPKDVEIHAKNKEKTSVISMTYTSIKFNEELKFPYQVPGDCTNKVVIESKKK